MKEHLFTTCALLILTVFIAVPSSSAAAEPYLAAVADAGGAVYAVNQDIALHPSWENGEAAYVGGRLEYTWSPQNLLVQQSGSKAVFRIPDPYDSLPLFVSADLTGVGTWIRPTALSDRVGGISVTVVSLQQSAPADNGTLTAAAGTPITLLAVWQDASGRVPESSPQHIAYRWTVTDDVGTKSINENGLRLTVRPSVPGSYVYTCTALTDDAQSRELCSVSFPVAVTQAGESPYRLSISAAGAGPDGVCLVTEEQSALLSVLSDPELPDSASYQWEQLDDALWTTIQGATQSTYNARGSSEGIRYRCRVTSGSWTGLTGTMEVRYSGKVLEVESQPYDVSTRTGTSGTRMQTTVRYDAGTVPSALWQYRQNESCAWITAASLGWFSENEPASASSNLVTFSWTLNDAQATQSGQYRCIISDGTADVITDSALLTVFEAEQQLTARSPFEVLPASIGTIVTGVGARPKNAPLSSEQLAECFMLPSGYTLAVMNGSEPAGSSDTVGTGRQLQLLNAATEIEDAATLVMPGDVTGSGIMTLSQLVRLAQAFSGDAPLYGPYALAADMTGDGKISLSDLVAAAQLLRNDSNAG